MFFFLRGIPLLSTNLAGGQESQFTQVTGEQVEELMSSISFLRITHESEITVEDKPQSSEKGGEVRHLPKSLQRPRFIPLTGNPENGDYLDWFRVLREGTVIQFPQTTKK